MGLKCECGCGGEIKPDSKGRVPRFLRGHHRRGTKLSAAALAKRKKTRLERGGGVYLRTGWKQPTRVVSLDARFDGGYEIDEHGCWLWNGKTNNGYGRLYIHGTKRYVYAHRYAYERFVGPIPEGCEVDHMCHDGSCEEPEPCHHRRCVNPSHLSAVTHRENVARGNAPSMRAAVAQTCTQGHPRSESVLRRGTGAVVYCKACRREKRAAVRASVPPLS